MMLAWEDIQVPFVLDIFNVASIYSFNLHPKRN